MSTVTRRTVIGLAAAAMLAVAGCGGDESGSEDTATAVSAPTLTSPLGTATAPGTTPTAKAPKAKGNGGVTPPSGGCTIPDTYQDFKFDGLDCSDALAVATAWDQNGKSCNTVDNPESPIGPQRTCTVNGYSCLAKRDVYSDGRFVTCTQGGATVRFTWYPI